MVVSSVLKEIQSYSERLEIRKLRGAYVKIMQAASNPDLLKTHAGKINLDKVLFAEQFGFEKKDEDEIEIEMPELNLSI